MAHGKLVFALPAGRAEAFEAFFNHALRLKWDTLLDVNYVEGGGTHPYVGAITTNEGRGWKRALSMRTRFLTYDPPRHAAAALIEPMGPFARWGASMRFDDAEGGRCVMTYTFTIHLRPSWLGKILDPVAGMLFRWETRRRFAAMARFLREQPVSAMATRGAPPV
jgi:hypothetical protein